MIINGKKLANEIKNSLHEKVLSLKIKPKLAIVKVGDNSVTEKFLEQKKKFASDIGILLRVYNFPESISTTELRKKVSQIVHIKENTGVVIQLPLPEHIKTDYILDGLSPQKDPDMLSSKSVGLFFAQRSRILPPVVGAIKNIFTAYDVRIMAQHAVVVGAGRLVGKPVSMWLINQGATVSVLNEHTSNPKSFTLNADIIVSGAGKPNLINSEMVKDGVVAVDCGTSEAEGRLFGDIDPEVEKKAFLFAPVPGGVGPLTIAMLFSNLVELAKINL